MLGVRTFFWENYFKLKIYKQELQFLWSACHLMMLYISMKCHKISWIVFKLESGNKMTIVKFQRGITSKMYWQELWFLWSVCSLMMLYISVKFHENLFKGFQDTEQTRFCDRPMDRQMDRQELWFLSSAYCLMMLYISLKFHENVSNGFQVIERTWNDHCQISKGNISKNV